MTFGQQKEFFKITVGVLKCSSKTLCSGRGDDALKPAPQMLEQSVDLLLLAGTHAHRAHRSRAPHPRAIANGPPGARRTTAYSGTDDVIVADVDGLRSDDGYRGGDRAHREATGSAAGSGGENWDGGCRSSSCHWRVDCGGGGCCWGRGSREKRRGGRGSSSWRSCHTADLAAGAARLLAVPCEVVRLGAEHDSAVADGPTGQKLRLSASCCRRRSCGRSCWGTCCCAEYLPGGGVAVGHRCAQKAEEGKVFGPSAVDAAHRTAGQGDAGQAGDGAGAQWRHTRCSAICSRCSAICSRGSAICSRCSASCRRCCSRSA
jgi:hypothetical protein